MSNIWSEINTDIERTITRARNSLVQIGRQERGVGAGVIYNHNGLVITNAHVARDELSHHIITANGQTFTGQQIAQDDVYDLAALKVTISDLEPIEHGDSESLRPGQLVFALGHPWGITGTTTAGVIISTESIAIDHNGQAHPLLAININLRPGNSGGPLIDSSGRLIGINTIMTGPESGIAIPAHVVERFATRLTVAHI